MDPHDVQPYVHNFVEDMNDSSYHTSTMWKLKFSQLDPSVALVLICLKCYVVVRGLVGSFLIHPNFFNLKAFVCKLEEDFLDLIDSLKTVKFSCLIFL